MTTEQLKTITQNFVQELKDAESGKKNSLAFLRNYVPTPFVKDGETFQVLVVGGSICRNVLMKKEAGKLTVLSHTEKEQPIFHKLEDFLGFIELEVDKTVTHIALNFAFPLQPTVRDGKLDGILLYGTKEHTFDGLQGKKVGEVVEQHIQNIAQQTIHICVANDTICLLLSGRVDHSWDELACAIVGTGVNAAFSLTEHEAVNLESGGFDKLPKDTIEEEIDRTSLQPGKQVFEKQVSGAYLYKYFNLLLKEKGTSYPDITSTKVLDDLARGEKGDEVSVYAKEVLEKSAQLVASQLAGIAAYQQRDLFFVIEGSLFWKGYMYKETVEETLKHISQQQITFIQVENSSVMGAAKLIA